MLGAPRRISCCVASSRSQDRILVAPFTDGNPLVTASVAAHLTHLITGRGFWSDRESRRTGDTFSCSPPTGPPSISSSPLPPFVQYFSFPLAHVLPSILVLTPQRIRRTPSGPAVHLSSLSTARQGVSGPRVVQAFIYNSLSAARKAYPDPEWSGRSSSLAIRRQEGVSGPHVVQLFIFTRYPPPGMRLWILSGPAVHLQSLSAARKASPDPGCSGIDQNGASSEKLYRQCFLLDRSWSNLEQTARNMRTKVTTRRWDFWAHVLIVCLRYGNDIDFIFCPIPCFCCALLQYVFLFFQKEIGRKTRSQNNLSFLEDASLSITIFGQAVVSQLTHMPSSNLTFHV